jgi:hypothetical protein
MDEQETGASLGTESNAGPMTAAKSADEAQIRLPLVFES